MPNDRKTPSPAKGGHPAGRGRSRSGIETPLGGAGAETSGDAAENRKRDTPEDTPTPELLRAHSTENTGDAENAEKAGKSGKPGKAGKAEKTEKVKKEQDNTLDEALEDTFPASDPVSISTTPRKPASKP